MFQDILTDIQGIHPSEISVSLEMLMKFVLKLSWNFIVWTDRLLQLLILICYVYLYRSKKKCFL